MTSKRNFITFNPFGPSRFYMNLVFVRIYTNCYAKNIGINFHFGHSCKYYKFSHYN